MVRSLNSQRKPDFRDNNNRQKKKRASAGMTVGEGNREAVRTKRTVRTTAMSFRLVLFMIVLIGAVMSVLLLYIKLQSDVTSTSREIADLEKELTELKSQNDAAYNEINDSINLEEVRERAINELGMKSADRDQVVIYSGEEKDSVNQVGDVGSK